MPECPDTPWDGDIDDRIPQEIKEPPARAAVFFLEFLKSKGIRTGKLVDLGCGNGRNAVLFEKDFEVHAIDKNDSILAPLATRNIQTYCHDVTDFLLFEDEFFDLAMDVNCYDEQNPERRENYRKEIRRVLKPDGYFLVSAKLPKEQIEKEFKDFEIVKSEDGNFIMK